MAAITHTAAGTINTEIVNGQVFTYESRNYAAEGMVRQRWRTYHKIDGKIVAYSDWIRRRRIQRRLEEKQQAGARS